jgi:hypothetical protein
MNDMLEKLAECSGWSITEDRVSEIAALYNGTMQDTRALRELDLGATVPAIVYKAGE